MTEKSVTERWTFDPDSRNFSHPLPGGLQIMFYKKHVASNPRDADRCTVGSSMYTWKTFGRREGREITIAWYDLISYLGDLARAYKIGHEDKLKEVQVALGIKSDA